MLKDLEPRIEEPFFISPYTGRRYSATPEGQAAMDQDRADFFPIQKIVKEKIILNNISSR